MGVCPVCNGDWRVPGRGLRYSHGMVFNDSGAVRLTDMEAKVLQPLMRGPLNSEMLLLAVYADDPDGGPLSAEDSLRVYLSRLRKKIKPLGYSISNHLAGPRYTPYTLKPL